MGTCTETGDWLTGRAYFGYRPGRGWDGDLINTLKLAWLLAPWVCNLGVRGRWRWPPRQKRKLATGSASRGGWANDGSGLQNSRLRVFDSGLKQFAAEIAPREDVATYGRRSKSVYSGLEWPEGLRYFQRCAHLSGPVALVSSSCLRCRDSRAPFLISRLRRSFSCFSLTLSHDTFRLAFATCARSHAEGNMIVGYGISGVQGVILRPWKLY